MFLLLPAETGRNENPLTGVADRHGKTAVMVLPPVHRRYPCYWYILCNGKRDGKNLWYHKHVFVWAFGSDIISSFRTCKFCRFLTYRFGISLMLSGIPQMPMVSPVGIWRLVIWQNCNNLFPRATSQAAALVRIFGDRREGQIPRCSAAGYLIFLKKI